VVRTEPVKRATVDDKGLSLISWARLFRRFLGFRRGLTPPQALCFRPLRGPGIVCTVDVAFVVGYAILLS
jgi:hypothetical protein